MNSSTTHSLPTVSVVVLGLEAGPFERTLRSALGQTHPPVEVVCVVPDRNVPSAFEDARAARPDLVRLVSVPAGDAATAWSRGLAEVKGDYVQLLAAGEQISSDKLTAQLEIAGETGADIVAGASQTVAPGSARTHVVGGKGGAWLNLLSGRLGSLSANLWQRERAMSVAAQVRRPEDDLAAELLKDGCAVAYDETVRTTVHVGAGSTNRQAVLEGRVRAHAEALRYCEANGLLGAETKVGREVVFNSVRQLAEQDLDAAAACYRWAFPDGYVPPVSRLNGRAYVATLRVGGFTAAERVRRLKPFWERTVGDRYQAIRRLERTRRTFADDHPSPVQSWAHTARLFVAPQKTVLFYPMRPKPYSVLYKLCVLAGYRMTSDPQARYDAVIQWDDVTQSDVGPYPHAEAAINRYCTDISKERVAKAFADVFGYALEVDPTTYDGAVVKKSDQNATHDGEVIVCPISPDHVAPGFVYQKAVDNRRDDGQGFYEYRVPIFDGTLPVVYVKYRPLEAQFKAFDSADVTTPDAVLSPSEQEQVLGLARALYMEYGEMDVLRDRGDGRIYVVDANDTPSGPERGFRPEQSVEALRRLQPAFEALLAESARRLAHGTAV